MAEFEAKITGIADLSKAKQDFDSFKKQIEQPIKITFDTNGFNAIWGNLQKQAQQQGSQIGKSLGSSLEKNVKNIKVNLPLERMFKDSGATSIASHLGIDVNTAQAIKQELKDINKEGASLSKLTIGNNGKSFEAIVQSGNTAITVLGKLEEEENQLGITTSKWVTSTQKYTTDFSSSMKQAQADAQKLAQNLDNVGKAFSNGDFSANVATMAKQLGEVSDTVSQNLVQKATDAANEYKQITAEITASINGTSQNPLEGQALVDAYKKSEDVLKRYRNAMKEVKADTTKMFAEGANMRAANDVEAWAKKNTRALKQYGTQLQSLAQQMRDAKSAGELSSLQNQFKNLKSEINAAGLGGLTFGDQLKRSFARISEFTGIYAITSQVRQLPREMLQEVIKLDTAMTELRKVSTASSSEISSYFDKAADSAYKYGQAINEIIDSTASWTRLGYNLKDASILTDVTAELAQVGSGLDTKSATEGLQATMRGFGLAAEDAKRVGDLINEVADTQPIDALGIINGLERSSAVMRETNNTLEETVGLITATTSVTQDATSAGTAWRTVALRITGAKSELEEAGLETDGMVESTAKLRDYLLQVANVDILDETGKSFKGTYQIMEELSKVWGQLTDLEKQGILDKIAGKRGSVAVSSVLQNWNIAESAKNTALTSDGSMDRQLDVYNQSIQASLDKFHVAFQELSADIINSDFVKAIIDVGTTIIKVIDELVKHIGVLGTAVTALGISKIATTFVRGAKDVDIWTDSFKIALDILKGTDETLGTKGTALSAIFDAITDKANGAGSALKGLGGVVGSVLSNPFALGIGATALAGLAIYKTYKKQQEELIKQASETTDSWNNSKAGIDDYKQRYIELNEQLGQANLTESEQIAIKQQLFDLQNEIVGKYGDQVSGIDLVNGRLQTQLGIINQISEKEAKRNLQDNTDAYQKSVDEMTKSRTYEISGGNMRGGMAVREMSKELQEQVDSLFASANFTKDGEMFKFTGDATDFDEAVREVLDGLSELKETASEADSAILQNAIDSAQGALKKNNKVLTDYQENYRAFLEQSLYSEGYGDRLSRYAQLTQEYNDALFSGNIETIDEAKSKLDEYEQSVGDVLKGHPEYKVFFDEIKDTVDTTTEAVINFKDIVDDGVARSSNGLAQYERQLNKAVGNIKNMNLDSVDVRSILQNGGAGFDDLNSIGEILFKDFDPKNENMISALIDLLGNADVIATQTSDDVDLATSSFEDFLKGVSGQMEAIDKANAALVNSFKSGGLSASINKETGELEGDVQAILNAYGKADASTIFERTANGIIVNRDALHALQSEQEATIKLQFHEKIAEAQLKYNEALKKGDSTGAKYWEKQLNNVKLLSSAYDGATSAYQKWVDAQSMGEAGDQYDTIASTALKRGKELYDKGLVGTNEFRAIAQLYTDQDLALASVDEITEAYEQGVTTVRKYFTEGQEGAVAFADKMVELGAATKEGDFYNFEDGIDTSKIADELDISVDLVEAAFKKLGDYGFNIHFMDSDQLAELDTLTEKATTAQDKLKELADEGGKIGDTDITPVLDIDVDSLDTVKECKSALELLGEVEVDPEINPEAAEAYQSLLDQIQAKLDLLSQTDIGNEVNFENLDSAYSLLGSLQGRMNSINSLNATSSVDIDVNGDDKVQEVAEQISNLPPEIKKAVGFKVDDDASKVIEKIQNKEVKIPVSYQQPTDTINTSGTATVNVEYEQGTLPTISAQTVQLDYTPNPINADVVAVLNTTAVDKYKPENKDATVVFGKDSSSPDNYDPSDKYATVNYSININGASALDNLPESGNRYITYHINTVGSIPGQYKGTVSKSAFQGISHLKGTAHAGGLLSKYGLKQDENSLVNELGAEIVVRPSEDSWMIFNNGMPTFAQLRKGDVIFDAEQTNELLSKGWTKNYASILGGAFASGTAHGRRVVGGGTFKKATTSGGNKGGGGGNGGGGGGNGGGNNNKSSDDVKTTRNTLDEVEILISRIERQISNLDKTIGKTYLSWSTRNKSILSNLKKVRIEIKDQNKAYDTYIKKAKSVDIPTKWKKVIQSGKFNIAEIVEKISKEDSNQDKDTLWDKIQAYKEWYEKALAAKDAIKDLATKEAELYKQRFDNEKTYFEQRISNTESAISVLDTFNERLTEGGRLGSKFLIGKELGKERTRLVQLNKEYSSLIKKRDNAVKNGNVRVGSEMWYDMTASINEVSQAIAETEKNIISLNKNMKELDWDRWDAIHDAINGVSNELEFLYNLIDEDKMFDDTGKITNQGVTAFALLAQEYDTYLSEAQRYQAEINSTQEALNNDKYNQNLVNKLRELKEAQQGAISNAEKVKDAMVDVTKNGIKKQIDYIKDLIDEYEDLLDKQKSQNDYAKNISNQQKELRKLEKQYKAISNDNSEEGAARRQKLRAQIEDKRQAIQNTQNDRRISETKEMLSSFEKSFEEFLNNKLNNVEAIVRDVITTSNSNRDVIKNTIETLSKSYGYTPSDTLKRTLSDMSTNLVSYFNSNGRFDNPKVSTIADGVTAIVNYFRDAQKNSEDIAKGNKKDPQLENPKPKTPAKTPTKTPAKTPAKTPVKTPAKIDTKTDAQKKKEAQQKVANAKEQLRVAKDNLAIAKKSKNKNAITAAEKDLKEAQKAYNNAITAEAKVVNSVKTATVKGNVVNINTPTKSTTKATASGGGVSSGSKLVDNFTATTNNVVSSGSKLVDNFVSAPPAKHVSEWVTSGGKKYYYKADGTKATGITYIAGKYYSFDKNGVLQNKSEAQVRAELIKSAGTHMLKYKDANGNTLTGYYKDDGTLDAKHTGWAKKGNKIYRFENGKLVTSKWITVSGKKYYVDSTGARVTGKQTINNVKYTFDDNGVYKKKGWRRGTSSVPKTDLAWTNENGKSEAIIRKSDGAILTPLSKGDSVIPNSAMKNMYQALTNPAKYLKQYTMLDNTSNSQPNVINMQFIANGVQDPNKFANELMNNKKIEKWIQEITLGQANGKNSYKKYSYIMR